MGEVGVKTLFIEPGSPWENGYVESFNGKLRDELLKGEIYYTLREAKVLVERWRIQYNTVRPHSSLGYRPPAPAEARRVKGTNGMNGMATMLSTPVEPLLRFAAQASTGVAPQHQQHPETNIEGGTKPGGRSRSPRTGG